MEYIRVTRLEPGMILAKDIYDENYRVLLRSDKLLTEEAIRAIKNQNYKGVYVNTNLRDNQEFDYLAETLIDIVTQFRIIQYLKRMYNNPDIKTDSFNKIFMNDLKGLEEELDTVIDVIASKQSADELIFEVEDGRSMNNWIYYHLLNVCMISIGIGLKMSYSKSELKDLAVAAILHDMGKSWLDSSLIEKENPSAEDLIKIRQHSEFMFRVLQKHTYPVSVTYAIWQHHEKCDGTGYPNKLKAEKIVKNAKIIAVANVYDNLINITPYNKTPKNSGEAIEIMYGAEGFDTDAKIALLKVVVPYPSGSRVRLSNNEIGLVVKNTADLPLRPILIVNGKLVDLRDDIKYCNITVQGLIE